MFVYEVWQFSHITPSIITCSEIISNIEFKVILYLPLYELTSRCIKSQFRVFNFFFF